MSKDLVDQTSLGVPILRESDLPPNASRFETLVAAPSDEELQTMWTIWSSVFALYSLIIVVVFLGIVSSRRVRAHSFNHYLIYVMLPDILYTCLCTVQCAVLAVTGGPSTPFACRLQSFYLIFGNGANSWMNAIIAYQIHRLLQISRRGERYVPPTRTRIAFQAMCAYVWAALIALLGIFPISNHSVVTVPFYGLGCVPTSYDAPSSLFFWLFYYPAFALVPMAYLVYVTIDIWRKSLLPRQGRRREISLYYVRILVAVYVMWLPALVTIYGFSVGAWKFTFAGLWIHAQGAVSALVSLTKEDIWRAVCNFITCQCSEENKKIRKQNRSRQSNTFVSGVFISPKELGSDLSPESSDTPVPHKTDDLGEQDDNDEDSDFFNESENDEDLSIDLQDLERNRRPMISKEFEDLERENDLEESNCSKEAPASSSLPSQSPTI